jgi:hypothetical protein
MFGKKNKLKELQEKGLIMESGSEKKEPVKEESRFDKLKKLEELEKQIADERAILTAPEPEPQQITRVPEPPKFSAGKQKDIDQEFTMNDIFYALNDMYGKLVNRMDALENKINILRDDILQRKKL